MNKPFKYVFFYSLDEIDVKDVESEIFSEKREPIHFYFFHNRDMHFSKSVILKKTLIDMIDEITPEFDFFDGDLIMTKVVKNFNNEEFDIKVDKAFLEYMKRINYRIDCIFQTFGLFVNLYKDRNLVFVFPFEIIETFKKYIDEYNIPVRQIKSLKETEKDVGILERVNYYAGQNLKSKNQIRLNEENISDIYSLI